MPPQDNQPPPTMPPESVASPMTPATPVPQSPSAPLPTSPPVTNIVTKPRFSKKLVFIILGLLVVLGLVVFLVSRLLGNGSLFPKETILTWWGLWESETVVAPLIAEYQQQNPNVKINYVNQSPEDYRERLTSALAQGTGPDIFRFHNSWTPMFRSYLSPMPSTVMTPAEFSTIFYPVASADLTVGSEIVGVPLEFDSLALYINEEIFQTYQKQPPVTWTDVVDLAKALTIRDENGVIVQSGVAMGTTDNVDHWQEIVALLMLQNKVVMNNPTGDRAAEALNFYTRFVRTEKVWDSTLPPSTLAFAGGKLAMYFAPSWRAPEIKRLNPNLRFKVVEAPQLPKEREDEPSIYYATYWAEGVSSESSSEAAGWDFLKFMSQRETLEKFYQNSVASDPNRLFGEPYSRVDMLELISANPIIGAIARQGKDAKSWYLATRTFDGPTGINSLLAKYFADAINTTLSGVGGNAEQALTTLNLGVNQVLSQYGLVRPLPSPTP